ncbi:hypothetical protein [Pseudomonas chlororaphis]|nr:hypothetical protein [Pseudomonas chlororaphis]
MNAWRAANGLPGFKA